MLYSKDVLESFNRNREKFEEAMQRYLHKYSNDRKNLKKLKPHEKDFLFQHLSLLVGEVSGINPKLKYTFSNVYEYYQYIERKGLIERKFDLYKIDEAHEYLFYRLILTYFDNLYFQEKSYSAFGKISKRQLFIDKKFMDRARKQWMKLLLGKSGPYLPHIYDEYNRKRKLLNDLLKTNTINGIEFIYRMHQLELVSFHLYYFIRLWFGDKTQQYHEFWICGLRFVFDPYSYVHIMSRHYMQSINEFDVERSFNDELPFIDIRNLPISFERILRLFSFYKMIYSTDEYIILKSYGSQYILWFSFRILHQSGISEKVMHIRTFYKIKEHRDFKKIEPLTTFEYDRNLTLYI